MTWPRSQFRPHPGIHVGVRKDVHDRDTIHPPHLPCYTDAAEEDAEAMETAPMPCRIWQRLPSDRRRRLRAAAGGTES